MTSEALNPFEPPKADEPRAARPKRKRRREPDLDDLVDARPRIRFTNYVVDLAFCAMIVGLLGDETYLGSLVVTFVYYVFFESLFRRTPGKRLTRTRVITLAGGRPSFVTVLKRSFVRLIPFEPLSYLGSGRGWHDRWSGTRVVHDPEDSSPRRRRD